MSKETLTPLQSELLARADSIMAAVASTVDKASAFASDQIPDIAMQYVAYGRSVATVSLLFVVIGACIGAWLFIRVGLMNSRNFPEYDHDIDGRRYMSLLSGGVIMAVAITKFNDHIKEFLMVWLAPKVWLINELVNLIKQ